MKKDKRPDWKHYFMDITNLVSTRSTCLRRGVGAIIVENKHILATGYNGVPRGITHCEQTGCLREKLNVPSGQRAELCRGLHAEQNAIIQAATHGVKIEGADLYCTHQPCVICSKMIINAGIKKVYIAHPYPDELAQEMLSEAGITVEVINTKDV
ncbi:MAG: cytidine deaminase [Candidatus Muiribacterium halophilum]|mgnify:CR=1 FL=1|uniref:Cytidine deaminase n=1 Tax=Muiribacterium halophilum TaxID=2053465 RepID=A0A2N5ZEC2_MUIH1|nr:MAG: cytidine deaminase [Candidatus Muirbacterium halophilum]